ncbi:unnamed protein product [Mytilus edulis]|uniref:Uncharacterized protein n=1 Tax=Mytilus edulis TaxID=6550 RepID=A0A8S3UYL2_MYTED|nr:unnamed protein product [Mytilus edulis]
MFILQLSFSFCLESEGPCELIIPILEDMIFPKPACQSDTAFMSKGFSLEQWYRERKLVFDTVLPGHYVSELLEQTGLTSYIIDDTCHVKAHDVDGNGWKIDCSKNRLLPNISSYPLVCHLKSSCTEISCCMNVDFIEKTIELYLKLNQDLQLLEIGIGKHQLLLSLIGFDFGIDHEFRLLNVFRVRYNIYDLLSENEYLITLEVSVCWESYKPCSWSRYILHSTRLPKLQRKLQNDFRIKDFDLSDWTSERGINASFFSHLDLLRLYNDLDIGWYFSTVCAINTTQIKSFVSECSALIDVPVLPSTTKCKLYESCSNISCCIEVPELQRSFNMFLQLDTCNFKLTVGIEKLHYIQMLFDYNWGSNDSFWLNGIFKIQFLCEYFSYQIHQLHYAKKYRMSVALEVCMSSREPCSQNTTVLDSVDMPQEECDWRQNYTISDFAYNTWLGSKLSLQDISDKDLILQLKEETGIGFYLEKNTCADDFKDTVLQSNCSKFETRTLLDGPVMCDINEQCTAIDCCVYDKKTQENYKIFIHLNSCNDTVTVGIEKYKFSQSLLDFDWNHQHELYLGGIFRIQYKLEDLPGLKSFVVSMKVSICWSSNTECDYSVIVLENIVLEKEVCEWKKPFLKQDFSLTKWEAESGYTVNITLHGQALTDLLEDLGVSKYYEKNQCNRSESPYFPQSSDGWNIACPHTIQSTYSLPDNMVCSLSDTCTSVDCCVDIKLLGRSFHIYLDIDPCHYMLTVGIERMRFNKSLLDYSWGSVLAVSLYGVINLEFAIDDLPDDKMFIISLNVSVCLEANSSCSNNNSMVLRNVLLPKRQCKFTKDFVVEDFSLTKWMSDRDIIRTDVLKEYMLYQILEELDATPFLNEYSCDRSREPWGPTNNGWMHECPNYLTLPYLNGAETSCITLDTCTGIRCCVEAVSLGRSFVMSFELDACNFMLTITIEKFVHNESLVNYVYAIAIGIEKFQKIHSDELPTTREYVVSLTLGVCLESTEPNCMIRRVVADKTSLPKPSCDWNNGFSMQNFSLEQWAFSKGLDFENLSEVAVLQVLRDLDLSKYMKKPPCNRNNTFYNPKVNGWKNSCPVTTDLTELQPGMTCTLLSSCTKVDCCVDVDIIDHSFNVILQLDPCEEELINQRSHVFDQQIFWNTKLTKKPCKWHTGFKDPECIQEIQILPALYNNMNCYIDQTCTAVQCCVDVTELGKALEIGINVDPCDFRLTVRIEKLSFDVTLFDYVWGKQELLDLYGVIQISFTIDNLYEEKLYLVNLNVSVRFDARTQPQYNIIMKNNLLPKAVCDWTSDFYIQDFSLKYWLQDKGYQVEKSLPSNILYQLYEETNIGHYFLDNKCSKSHYPYDSSWTKDCGMNMTLPMLPSDISCYITDTCTGIQCCVMNNLLQQTFEVSFLLDSCLNRISISIEKIQYNSTLLDFKWGTYHSFRLQGIVRVEYSIEDLYTERYYLVNMRISFCYESAMPECESQNQFIVLQNTKLPKQQCDWTSDFHSPGFSLETWYNQHSLVPGSQLKDWMISELLNDLGISLYLNTKQCSRHSSLFFPSSNGCSSRVTLPDIPEPTSCYLDSSCTKVECCVDVDFIPYSFHTYLDIDPCKQMITVGIEKFHRNISLTNYQWGVQEEFWLAGVLRLSYKIDDFDGESQYLVSLNMSVCFESNKTCHMTAQILSNTWLKKTLCAWDNSYYISNFSLSTWLEKENMSVPLPSYGKMLLFEDTGLAPYLLNEECRADVTLFNRTVLTNAEVQQFSLAGIVNIKLIIEYLEEKHSYLVSKNISICTESQGTCDQDYVILENTMLPVLQCSSDGGFVKEVCPSTDGPENLSGPVSCNLDAACNKIRCCVDVEDLGRAMEVSMSLDHCNSKLTHRTGKIVRGNIIYRLQMGMLKLKSENSAHTEKMITRPTALLNWPPVELTVEGQVEASWPSVEQIVEG